MVKCYHTYLVAYIDREIARYYISLIPKAFQTKGTRYAPHITIVRYGVESVTDISLADKYDGMEVEFEYDPVTYFHHPYFFHDVFSRDIGDIRESLGMLRYRDGFDRYHFTIGNVKKS